MAQPRPIRPNLDNQMAIYDMQVSHSLLAASEMHYNEAFKNITADSQNQYATFELLFIVKKGRVIFIHFLIVPDLFMKIQFFCCLTLSRF